MTALISKLGPAQMDSARSMDLGELLYEARQWGLVRLISFEDGTYSVVISRLLGDSELKTNFATCDTMERAALSAILAAEKWGLPKLVEAQ